MGLEATEATARNSRRRGPAARRHVAEDHEGQPEAGTINGGGPEIEARTFSGAVFIRRGPQ